MLKEIKWLDRKSEVSCDYIQARDDSIACFFTMPPKKIVKFYYIVNLVTPEQGFVPPATATCMYDPSIKGASNEN